MQFSYLTLAIFTPDILEKTKPQLKEVKHLPQDHTISWQQSQDLKLRLSGVRLSAASYTPHHFPSYFLTGRSMGLSRRWPHTQLQMQFALIKYMEKFAGGFSGKFFLGLTGMFVEARSSLQPGLWWETVGVGHPRTTSVSHPRMEWCIGGAMEKRYASGMWVLYPASTHLCSRPSLAFPKSVLL